MTPLPPTRTIQIQTGLVNSTSLTETKNKDSRLMLLICPELKHTFLEKYDSYLARPSDHYGLCSALNTRAEQQASRSRRQRWGSPLNQLHIYRQ